MNNSDKKIVNCRFENKAMLNSFNISELEILVKSHPALFCEIHKERYVNNIYFDSVNLDHYFDNVAGISQRRKIRVRWYGDMKGYIANPILEFKKKAGFYVKKQGYLMNGFTVDDEVTPMVLSDAFRRSNLPEEVLTKCCEMAPVFFNRYLRKYYISACKRFRLTLDINMELYEFTKINNHFSKKYVDRETIIFELKYDKESIVDAESITDWFPFRITRNSKFVQGMEMIYTW